MRLMMEARVRRAGAQAALVAAVMMSGAVSAFAQQPTTPPATQPAQPAQPAEPAAAPAAPAAPQLTFDSDYVVWFYAVKAGNGPQFEQFFTRVKEAMEKSTNPGRKEQAAGMKLLKSTTAAPDGTMNYVLIINPVAKGQEYSPGMLLFEVFPTEAKKLVDELQTYINEQGLNAAVPLTTVMPLGPAI